MSRRPKVQTRHERATDRATQQARRARDRAIAASTPAREIPAALLEPVKCCVGRGAPARPIPKAVQAWIAEESAQQLKHYRRIAREMDALGPQRDAWAREFFDRITGPRGFSVHAGMRKTIARSALPERPDRHWRVVW
jgi:hypothetical protein